MLPVKLLVACVSVLLSLLQTVYAVPYIDRRFHLLPTPKFEKHGHKVVYIDRGLKFLVSEEAQNSAVIKQGIKRARRLIFQHEKERNSETLENCTVLREIRLETNTLDETVSLILSKNASRCAHNSVFVIFKAKIRNK